MLVINRVRVLGGGPHTPTQFFWEYPPGYEVIFLCNILRKLRWQQSRISAPKWASYNCFHETVYFQREFLKSKGNYVWKVSLATSVPVRKAFSRVKTLTYKYTHIKTALCAWERFERLAWQQAFPYGKVFTPSGRAPTSFPGSLFFPPPGRAKIGTGGKTSTLFCVCAAKRP